MMRIILQTIFIALFVALIAYNFFGDRLRGFLINDALDRQVQYVCKMVDSQRISSEVYCKIPLPEVPELRNHYSSVKEKDEEWYRARGWSYFPVLTCEGEKVRLSFMGRKFQCRGGVAVEEM